MFVDETDDPGLTVRLISIDEADTGALEEPARAIAIQLSVTGKGRFVVYGIDLSDGDFTTTCIGPVPNAAMKKASEITELWIAGSLRVPFTDISPDA